VSISIVDKEEEAEAAAEAAATGAIGTTTPNNNTRYAIGTDNYLLSHLKQKWLKK